MASASDGGDPYRDTRRSGYRNALLTVLALCTGAILLLQAASGGRPELVFWAICFFLAATLSPRPGRATGQPLPALLVAAPALLAAAFCVAFALQQIPVLGTDDDYLAVAATWIAGIGFYLLAFRSRGSSVPRPAVPVADRRLVLAVVAISVLAAVLRLWDLRGIPLVFQGDEANFAVWGLDLTSRFTNPLSTGFMSQPTLGLMLEGLMLRLVPDPIVGARLLWALLGIAAVPLAYLFGARLAGKAVGLLTAFLLATYHFHLHYSRTGINNIADTPLMLLALLLLLAAIDGRRLLTWAWLGAVTGVALYFYQGARLTPLVVLAALGFAALTQGREFRRGLGRRSLVAVGAFLVAAAPMLQLAVLRSDDFNARTNEASVLRSGWLAGELAAGRSLPDIVWRQLEQALIAFNVSSDVSDFYKWPWPLLDSVFGVAFIAGLLLATVLLLFRRPHWPLATVIAWWWGGLLLGGAMMLGAPASQRLVTLTVPVCLFIALAIDFIVRRLPLPARAGHGLRAALALSFAVSGLWTYFAVYTPLGLSGGQHAALITRLLPIVEAAGPDATVIFAGAPFDYWDFPSRPYLAPHLEGRDQETPFTAPPPADLIPAGRPAIFVFVPARASELAYVRQTFPAGREQTLASPDGRPYAVIYETQRAAE